jgi:hypothetical protein
MKESRQFIRHPADVPIEISMGTEPAAGGPRATGTTRDVSLGGLAFHSLSCPDRGQLVEIHIPTVKPEFRTQARVVWCRSLAEGYEVGVAFLASSDAFRVRMVEQVCQIEHYRAEVREREGRVLSGPEAASEWIRKYAAAFPGAGEEPA